MSHTKSKASSKPSSKSKTKPVPPVDEDSMTIEYSADTHPSQSTQQEIEDEGDYQTDEEEEEGEGIALPTSEKAKEFCLKMLDEMEPVDSDDPEGRSGFMMLRDRHGYAMLKVMENKLKLVNKAIKEERWHDAYDMMDAFTIAIKIQDFWMTVDDGEYVDRICGRIAKTYQKVVKALAKVEPKLSEPRREEIKASIEKVCEYGNGLEDYGIESFQLDSSKLTKLFN